MKSEQGQLILMHRFIEGVSAYAERWSGKVTVLLRETDKLADGLDPVVFSAEENNFDVELLAVDINRLNERLKDSALVLGTIANENLEIARLCLTNSIPLVWITETTVRTRSQIIDAEKLPSLRRMKRQTGNFLEEKGFQKSIIKATSAQCNGLPTYLAYKNIAQNALLFFDSRVKQNLLVTEDEIRTKQKYLDQGLPLRLVFSGRLTEIKGVEFLLDVAKELNRQSIPFRLDIYGDGNLKSKLESEVSRLDLDSKVQLHGVLDFQTELVPTLKQSADIFLCCHLQGDPSCTYLETLACGIPIIGFSNEAWQGLYEMTQAGWLVEIGNSTQMAASVVLIHQQRSLWLQAALAALQFAEHNTFEMTMTRRVEHLQQYSKSRVNN